MTLAELNSYVYIKQPLNERYPDVSLLSQDFFMDWLKDVHDYVRTHSDDELKAFSAFTPEEILNWLEEAAAFVWETKKGMLVRTHKP